MNILQFAFYIALMIYSMLFDRRFIFIYLGIIGVYCLGAFFTPNSKFNSLRRKIMIASWTAPSESNILNNWEMDVTTVLAYFKTFPEKNRPTLTHFVIKVMGKLLADAPDINGRIVFGKYVPYDKVNVSCLVDVNGGEDLAAVLFEEVDKMSISDIQDYIRDKATKIKQKKDPEHKKKTGPMKFIPSFLIQALFPIFNFLLNGLMINMPSQGFKAAPFGACVITSLGMLGIKNTFAPQNLVSQVPFMVAICEVQKKPVVRDNAIVIRDVCNINTVMDHRFADGGRSKKLNTLVYDIFANPEKYFPAPKH